MPEVSEERSVSKALDAAGVFYTYLYPSSSGGWQIEARGSVNRIVDKLTAAGFTEVKGEQDYLGDEKLALVRFTPPAAVNPLRDKTDEQLEFCRSIFAEADDYEAVAAVDVELDIRAKRRRLTQFITDRKALHERAERDSQAVRDGQ